MARHGRFEGLVLETDEVTLVVVPELGAKVVSLVDRRTGRDWLTQGSPPEDPWAAPDAVFGGPEAYGWDECFPTVAPGSSAPPPWDAGPLRDHGELWGRPWVVDTHDEARGILRMSIDGPRGEYRFRRRIHVLGAAIHVAYEVDNRLPAELPFLWSMHPLLSLRPGERIGVRGLDRVTATHVDHPDLPAAPATIGWPRPGAGAPADLDVVGSIEARSALKLYGGPLSEGRAAAAGNDGWLGISWDVAAAPFLGLWLDYGGWPPGEPLHQVALEPTTAPADDLATALRLGHARALPAGGSTSWTARMEVGIPAASVDGFLGARVS